MELIRLTTGDVAYRYDKSIALFFSGARKVLSTSLYGGGYHEDYTAVFNRDMTQGAGMPCEMFADTYAESMRIAAQRIGLDPNRTTGMGTAAQMEHVSVQSRSYKELTVTAIVTGGVETNGGRVGDPATYYKNVPKKCGTINIILVIDADLPPGVLTRALVTCTEAKTAALQELMADSRYSCGLATGSGTDQTIIVANAESPLCFEGAGKHTKLGELIGCAVIAAVKESLGNQSGLTPARQHDLLRRLRRFGITGDTLWQDYEAQENGGRLIKPRFLDTLHEIGRCPGVFALGVSYIHLYDEFLWGLLTAEETHAAGAHFLLEMARCANVPVRAEKQNGLTYMQRMSAFLVDSVCAVAAMPPEGEMA